MSRFLKVMIVLLAIAAMATPAIADDYKYSLYGSVRMSTFYTDTDQADTQDFNFSQRSISRFGFKASKGPISGQVEYGTGVNLRLLNASYKFDGGKFTMGQAYGPFVNSAAQTYDNANGFAGYGDTYLGRRNLMSVSLDSGFSVWAIKNPGGSIDDNVEIPLLAVKYAGAAGSFSYHAVAGYQTFQNLAGDDVDSYLVTFGGKIDLNPVAIQFNAGYGQNADDLGLAGANQGMVTTATGTEDSDFLTGYIQASFKASDSHKLAVAVGYQSEDNDTFVDADNQMAFFIQDTITIAPGFYIVPEFDYVDGLDDSNGTDGEDYYAVGAKWQINF